MPGYLDQMRSIFRKPNQDRVVFPVTGHNRATSMGVRSHAGNVEFRIRKLVISGRLASGLKSLLTSTYALVRLANKYRTKLDILGLEMLSGDVLERGDYYFHLIIYQGSHSSVRNTPDIEALGVLSYSATVESSYLYNAYIQTLRARKNRNRPVHHIIQD